MTGLTGTLPSTLKRRRRRRLHAQELPVFDPSRFEKVRNEDILLNTATDASLSNGDLVEGKKRKLKDEEDQDPDHEDPLDMIFLEANETYRVVKVVACKKWNGDEHVGVMLEKGQTCKLYYPPTGLVEFHVNDLVIRKEEKIELPERQLKVNMPTINFKASASHIEVKVTEHSLCQNEFKDCESKEGGCCTRSLNLPWLEETPQFGPMSLPNLQQHMMNEKYLP